MMFQKVLKIVSTIRNHSHTPFKREGVGGWRPILLFCSFFVSINVSAHDFRQGNGCFLLDGKPFVIKAAELHYPRIPRPYWDQRIKMCKALGMNTICMYVFWNIHEQQPGHFDFSGNNDIRAFVQLAEKNGMYVIVRPGPYVCAEWEMGGLPWWLLRTRDVRLREQEPYFMNCVESFEKKVAEQLSDLAVDKGGPILMVQVENEYGSYGTNKPYVAAVRDCLREVGWDKIQLFQCDWSSNFRQNALDDMLWTMNFGAGADVQAQFAEVSRLRPNAPKMCSEFWSGWFDGWGAPHQTRSAETMVSGIKTMLDNGISFSLYMTHGGTSFAQWAGANNTGYAPDCTSYDYDAPINEQGAATEKYTLLRNLLQQYSDAKLPVVPKAAPIITVPRIQFTEMAPLFRAANMPEPTNTNEIFTMDMLDQGYGSVMYSTTLPKVKDPVIQLKDVHDYAIVYIDDKEAGRIYRGNTESGSIQVKGDFPEGTRLDIFVEAMGRINYSHQIYDEKGITGSVLVKTATEHGPVTYDLHYWKVYSFPFDQNFNDLSWIPVNQNAYDEANTGYPTYYRSTLNLKKVGDTYLDMSHMGKGIVWVNGHSLGRFWQVGPQQTLYLPGCWLRKGKNEIIVLDLIPSADPCVQGLDHPIVDQLHPELMPSKGVSGIFTEETSGTSDNVGNDAAPGAK